MMREGEEVHGAGAWIAAEAKRMKDANEISPDIRISDFARELEGRMELQRLPPLTSPSARSGGAASRTSS